MAFCCPSPSQVLLEGEGEAHLLWGPGQRQEVANYQGAGPGPGVPSRGPLPPSRPGLLVVPRTLWVLGLDQGTESGASCREGGTGWQGRVAFHLLLCTVPAAASSLGQTLPPPAFADLSAGPLLLDACRPGCSSTSSRKPSEPPRTGLQGPQPRRPSDDQVALT